MTKIKTYKPNKNSWKYNFVANLDNGKVVDYITIVTEYGKEYAEDCFRRSLEEQLERFNADWFSFHLVSKTKEK
jgi:hypothetical protein